MRSKPEPTIMTEIQRVSVQLQPKKILCRADRGLGDLEAEILLANILKKDRVWLHAHGEQSISSFQQKQFSEYVARRKKHEPIAYIVGHKDFYGLRMNVNSSVLVPRPSSETVVSLVLREGVAHAPIVLDVGTGSGAIAIAIAKYLPKANVIATDISDSALRVARGNVKRLGVKNILFKKANLLSSAIIQLIQKSKRPLIITANLPYLPLSDIKKLEPDVVKYEPAGALFSGKEGNDLIIQFLDQLQQSELTFQSAFIEFDHPQARAIKIIAKKRFPLGHIVIHKDLEKKNRVLEIRL
ncbi:MAG: peptide chain release factor N(5)-glutamine methyltransferase [bacterium]|nr:peptide chain release factor N(5)-glutamine methyltransferase [bacterium]